MTTILKLGVQGIRSFDHDRMEVLEFERPLTLIVGKNGTGKTTIIECLKMVSAGVPPPDSKNGQKFIHDPKVAQLPEVKAQIKMLFRTINGKEILAIRSFQLTNKKNAKTGKIQQTFKALESVLRTTGEEGDKASISHRCVDMDLAVPEHMGVSRAILESVIFCHQEDANWPLADMGVLKKRFDDIFGATRYTKALGDIKRLQKDWHKETKDKKHASELLTSHYEQAQKLQGQVHERQKQDVEIVRQLENADKQIVVADGEVRKVQDELGQWEAMGLQIAELQGAKSRIESEHRALETTMVNKNQDRYEESLEQLLAQVKNFTEVVLVQNNEKVQQEQKALQDQEQAYQTALTSARKLRNDLGEVAANADFLQRRQTELKDRLQASKQPSVAALRETLKQKSEEFERLEKEQRTRDAALEQSLQAAEREQQKTTVEATKNEARVTDFSATVRRLEEEGRALSRSESELDSVVRSIRDAEANLNADESNSKVRQLEERQAAIGRSKNDLQYSIDRKSREVSQLELQSGTLAEVEVLRKGLRESEESLAKKAAELRPQLTALLGVAPEPAEADVKLQGALQNAQEELSRHRNALTVARQKQSAAAARRTQAERELTSLEAEADSLQAKLNSPEGGLRERLAAQSAAVESARKDLAMTESAKHMYEKFREKSKSKNTCQFCKRGFGTDHELHQFEEAVNKLIEKIPEYFESTRRKLEEEQAKLKILEDLRPLANRFDQLQSTEIPKRRREVGESQSEEKQAQASIGPEDRECARLEQQLQRLNDVRAEVGGLQKLSTSVQEQRRSVQTREAKLLGNNSKVSLQAERDELRAMQEKLNELGREEDSLRSQRDLLSKQLSQQRDQLSDLKGKLRTLQGQVARSKDLQAELSQVQANLGSYTEAARQAGMAQRAAEADVKKFREERAQLATRYRQELSTRDGEVRNLQREADALSELEKNVKYLQTKVLDAETVKARLAEADKVCCQAESQLANQRKAVQDSQAKLAKVQSMRECLEANVKLKTLEKDAANFQAEADELQRKVGGKDVVALRRNLDDSRAAATSLREQRAHKDGELKQVRRALADLNTELQSTLYVDIDKRHRQSLIEYETANMTAADLGKYHAALDKALMKYHQTKMGEINKRIKELWQRVYRGKDIEYILIRSDTEEVVNEDGSTTPAAGAAPVARAGSVSYNYRVVMCSGDVELEMRGRCSAGQKVLASLIIRLALAETFCVNCGILALDEPTTNLDSANVRGLAEALAELIESRRDHKNFQLMLITHDEAFVDSLARLQVCDWYWQLRKSANGNSTVERKEMTTLGAA